VASSTGPALEQLLSQLPQDVAADVRLVEQRWGTMRFANGVIHQPHLERSRDVSLRVLTDGRLGTATTSDLSLGGIAALIASAVATARVAPREPRFPGFPSPDGDRARGVAFSEATARLSPEDQVLLAQGALEGAESAAPGSRVSGVVNVGSEQLTVANTSGRRGTTRRSVIQSSVLVERPEARPPVSGWSESAHWRADRLDPEELGRAAAARMPRDPPEPAKPGLYRTVLLGSAVSDLLYMLGYLGFGGHAEEEGWSCLKRHRGEALFPKILTLEDDARTPATLPQSIDFEGLAKRTTPLVSEGVVGEAVTDLVTAARLGRSPSGHGLPPEAPFGEWGPIPTRVLMKPGAASVEDLVRDTRQGILVTRLHYVRVVDPGKSVITGMTRDGTYRIEHGEVAAPIRNLRFTESILRVLRGLEAVGKARGCFADERGFSVVTCPPILSRSFRFTSSTLF